MGFSADRASGIVHRLVEQHEYALRREVIGLAVYDEYRHRMPDGFIFHRRVNVLSLEGLVACRDGARGVKLLSTPGAPSFVTGETIG